MSRPSTSQVFSDQGSSCSIWRSLIRANTLPLSRGGTSVNIHIYCPDADTAFNKAVAAGVTRYPLQMHLGGLRPVENLITPRYKLIVSGYDQTLENVQVLIRFKDGWAECGFINSELLSCKQVVPVVRQ